GVNESITAGEIDMIVTDVSNVKLPHGIFGAMGLRLRKGESYDCVDDMTKALIGRWTDSYESGALVPRYDEMQRLSEVAMKSLTLVDGEEFNGYRKVFDKLKMPLDLTGVDLRETASKSTDGLRNYNFSKLTMRHAILRGIRGYNLSFIGTDLSLSDSTGLILSNSKLKEAILNGAHFENSDFYCVSLDSIRAKNTHFDCASFTDSLIEKGNIEDLTHAYFNGARYGKSSGEDVVVNTFQDILNLRLTKKS
ncbi:MAG: pentapeptide repeat-containing protein, partial [Candidatus Margulisiibacteriota bacterium]